ncbi:MAG: tRNA (guanosine(37)-N1)-methyltransferase TrmD [Gammaproteobacteria bacterium]|nr:tRNA (guanosine(37)-N1)-methyltransferase TrmD [Gammaproteobacteria bacterium]
MRFDVISLFPELIQAVTAYGVTGRAVEQDLLQVVHWNPRDFAKDRHRTVDDRPYGGGPGMVMMVEPIRDCLRAVRQVAQPNSKVIYMSPQGKRVDQAAIRDFVSRDGMILIAGRYEGIDERLIETEVDEEWSIGDYVLSGGELPAMVLIDAVARLIPGALGDADSAEQDSFSEGLLDCQHYTRPEEVDGHRVPEVLLSGDHAKIALWRRQQALGRTWERRPDLIEALELDEQDRRLLQNYQQQRRTYKGERDEQDY